VAIKQLWVEKYRPRAVDQYVFQDEQQRTTVKQWLAQGSIPHLLFSGVQGSGKTALARILISALEVDEMDLLTVNASDKTGVDDVRELITSFAETMPMGRLKIVHLEEFDRMSQAAQGALRVIIEESSDTCRFICTCNYENKIIPAIKSRLQVLRFKAPNEDEVFIQLATILQAENIEFDPDVIFTYIRQAYPDLRKIINNLELNTLDGKLLSPKESGADADYKFKILELIGQSDFEALYDLALKQVPQEEVEGLYEYVWQNLKLIPACKDKAIYQKAVLIIADGIRAHAVAAFPHITFQAVCIRLIMVLNS
jgi:DNA polymerase III delta prime subunit